MLPARTIIAALAMQSGLACALDLEHLSSVAQDSNNFIYFPSHKGLLRYDGQHILNLSEFSNLPKGLANDIEISKTDVAYVLYTSGQVWSIDLKTLNSKKFAETTATNIEITKDSLFAQERNRITEYDLVTGTFSVRLSGKEHILDIDTGYESVYALANDGLYHIKRVDAENVVPKQVNKGNLEVTPHGAVYFANDHLGYYSHLQDTTLVNEKISNASNLTYVPPYFVYYTDRDTVNEVALSTLEKTRTDISSTSKSYLSLFADKSQQLWGLNINEFGVVEGSSRTTPLRLGSAYNLIERVGKSWWIGSTKGIYVDEAPVTWVNDAIGQGKEFEVTAFSYFAGKLIVSTSIGSFAVSPELKTVDKIYAGYVLNSSVIDEKLYLATNDDAIVGLNAKLEYEDINAINSVLISEEVLNVTQIGSDIYISTAAGLDKVVGKSGVSQLYQGDHKVTDAAELNGQLYMSTYGDGLLVRNNNEWTKIPSPSHIREIVEARDKLYLLTNNGIHVFSSEYNATRLIRETQNHSFIVGSLRIVDDQFIAISDKAFIELTETQFHELAPPVVSFIQTPSGIHFKDDALEIENSEWMVVSVSNLQYANNEGVHFEYQFNGNEWRPINSAELHLNGLKPNNYQIQFRQVLGNTVSEPTTYEFKVRSEWYNSPKAFSVYFAIAVFVVAAIAFYTYFWIQSFRRVYRQNEYKRQSSNVGRIAMLNEQAKVLIGSGDDTMFTEGLVKLDKISELVAPIVNNGPYLGDQKLTSGVDLLQVQSSLQAKVKVNFEVVLGNIKLDPQLEQDIYAVVYHGLHNAVHHSEGTEVNVFVHKLRSKIHVNIEDDGIGIPLRSRLHFGEGLYKMSDVAKSYKTKFKLKSSRKGTKIQIVFPLIERDRKSKEDIEREIRERM
ncbi:ATP-binding protein [Pseudoalteromonas luteoviolacea]|uniref:histidine kinase n=1 Tax=Pseudoalteromonas luteoviolacea DSM 6061 TaxID=1365250 RepID=A0A161XYB4_9GAMM|nr:ATP-binding protein [Pseudoalteromonas luteoviolacea]KZN39828.1 hypothetical protein N475_13805 [Pseudoalteromonas luteoviolacea DSM 6061]MBE0385767.1 hypothetical protein [Pseudoalteromonas luteoviolacea DSM 6061]